MSTLTISGSWTEFPLSTTVPFRTSSHAAGDFSRNWGIADIISFGRVSARNRILRLEVALAMSVVAFACFAWQTTAQESVLRQTSLERSRSIAALGDAVAKQASRTAILSEEVARASRDLATQSARISKQLETQDKEMAAIESRLNRLERTLHQTAQATNPVAE